MSSSPIPNDVTIQAAATPQLTIDLFDGWISRLPDELNVKAGHANLFNDPRTDRALSLLGSVEGAIGSGARTARRRAHLYVA